MKSDNRDARLASDLPLAIQHNIHNITNMHYWRDLFFNPGPFASYTTVCKRDHPFHFQQQIFHHILLTLLLYESNGLSCFLCLFLFFFVIYFLAQFCFFSHFQILISLRNLAGRRRTMLMYLISKLMLADVNQAGLLIHHGLF